LSHAFFCAACRYGSIGALKYLLSLRTPELEIDVKDLIRTAFDVQNIAILNFLNEAFPNCLTAKENKSAIPKPKQLVAFLFRSPLSFTDGRFFRFCLEKGFITPKSIVDRFLKMKKSQEDFVDNLMSLLSVLAGFKVDKADYASITGRLNGVQLNANVAQLLNSFKS
jgi:hypothetical protein